MNDRGFIDTHCHVLPGIDDGPADVDEAMQLVAGLHQLGFTEFHPTPHQRADLWAPTEPERMESFAELTTALAAANSPVRIARPGGENMWDGLFLERQDGGFPSYEGDNAFLVEFSVASPPPYLKDRLFELQLSLRRLPVVAHVERYQWLPKRPESLASRAALLVNLGTVGGQAGWRAKRRARRLLLDGLAHAAASDAHSVADLSHIAAGIQWIRERLGDEAVEGLLVDGPRCILNGEIP